MKHVISALCLLLVVLSPVTAQRVELLIDEGDKIKNPPEVVSLQYKFEPGELRRYDITVTGEGLVKLPGQTERAKLQSYTTMTFIQHAKSFSDADGTWKMEWDMISGTMDIPEFGMILLTVPPVDFEMDKYGAVRKIKGLDNLPVSPGLPQSKAVGDILAQLKFVGFPHKALRVDDEWNDKYTVKVPDQDAVTITSTSKVVGFEHIRTWDCVKIHTTYETPFTLKVPLEPQPAASSEGKAVPGGDEKSPSATAETTKPVTLKGTEKGEFWTYFAYAEGKLIQTFGSIELTADAEGAPSTDTPAKPESKPPQPPAQTAMDVKASHAPPAADVQVEQPKHDLYVKYQTISKFNAKLPESMEEVK